MNINQDLKNKFFDEFYNWLKADGLTPRKSERLYKKTIFGNLSNDDSKTIENFKDFLEDKKKQFKIFENQIISFDGVNEFSIKDVHVEFQNESFRLFFTNDSTAKFNFEQFERIKELINQS